MATQNIAIICALGIRGARRISVSKTNWHLRTERLIGQSKIKQNGSTYPSSHQIGMGKAVH